MFKDELYSLRKENNLSQKELAHSLNIAPSTLSMYESGKRMPNEETLKKIASFFSVTIDRLLCYSLDSDAKCVQNEKSEILRQKLNIMLSRSKKAKPEDIDLAISMLEKLFGE